MIALDNFSATFIYGAVVAATFISVWIGLHTSTLSIPIALADEFPNAKKRLEYYTFNSRKALVKGYSQVRKSCMFLSSTH